MLAASLLVVLNQFHSMQPRPLKCYIIVTICLSCLVEVSPALAQLETAGIVPKKCAGPDRAASA